MKKLTHLNYEIVNECLWCVQFVRLEKRGLLRHRYISPTHPSYDRESYIKVKLKMNKFSVTVRFKLCIQCTLYLQLLRTTSKLKRLNFFNDTLCHDDRISLQTQFNHLFAEFIFRNSQCTVMPDLKVAWWSLSQGS